MKPGRELDVLIAEKIFGWENNKDGPIFYGARNDQIYADTGDWKVIDCPCYSTNIEDAWEVFERVTILGSVYKAETPFWGCGDTPIRALSAPMAICLAALYSIGYKPQ